VRCTPSVTEPSKLLKVAARIGVADSERYLKKNRQMMGHVITPDPSVPMRSSWRSLARSPIPWPTSVGCTSSCCTLKRVLQGESLPFVARREEVVNSSTRYLSYGSGLSGLCLAVVLAMRLVRFTCVTVFLSFAAAPAQAQDCAGPAAPALPRAEAPRAAEAARYLEILHAAQTRGHVEKGRYLPLHELRDLPPLPVGFVPKVVADQWSYVVSVKDLFDSCGAAMFSDERGVVYRAHPRLTTDTREAIERGE
jgi:hypothetical protein